MQNTSRNLTAKRVLFLDDDPYIALPDVTELRIEGYDVEVCSDVAYALERLKEAEFCVIVTDLMMEDYFFDHKDTRGGLLTGIYFALAAKMIQPNSKIIIYSAATRRHLGEEILDSIHRSDWLTYVRKGAAEKISQHVKNLANGDVRRSKTYVSSVFDALELKPNFAGLGIDLKRLFDSVKDL